MRTKVRTGKIWRGSTIWMLQHKRTLGLAAALAVCVAPILVILDRPTPDEWRRAPFGGEGVALMSFNVLMGGAPPSATLDAIEAAAPDILCLQEMTPQFAGLFTARLGHRYPHRLFEPGRMTQGIGIASRHPLSGGQTLSLGLTYLPAVSATVSVKSREIRIACVHLMPPFARFKQSVNVWKRYVRNEAIRLRQVNELMKHLDGYDMPALVMGDMNEWPGQAAMTLLRKAGFADSCRAPGERCGPTWPGRTLPWPALFRIDHILGRDVAFSDAEVLEAGGSDHYPVAARVTFEAKRLADRRRR